MVSLDLSCHLNLCSKNDQSPIYTCNANSHGRQNVRTPRRSPLAVKRVEANRRGAGDEVVTCFSFGRASSLALVVIFLVGFVSDDICSLCILMGAVVSTVSAANGWRHENLMMQTERDMLQQSMRESSDALKLAIHELRQAENDLMTTVLCPTYKPQTKKTQFLGNGCGSVPQENNLHIVY